MSRIRGLATLLRRASPALLWLALNAGAHTLPISYLRLAPDADYLHLELVFNPFELTFVAEVDDNRDGGLDPGELERHGAALAKRMTDALKLSVGDRTVAAETAGMDPEMSGHHVRLRAHYKVDARKLPMKIESELNGITSASHLVQVTWASDGPQQLAQLDLQSPKVTFESSTPKPEPVGPRTAHLSLGRMLFLFSIVVVLAGLMRYLVARGRRL